jgi:riboflavin kinase / FMN adenylyltransferase
MNVITFGQDSWPHDQKACITVGTFDGVHRGHQGVISLMRKRADEQGLRVVVVTFDPHPQIVLSKPGREPLALLTTIEERCERLARVGVDDVVVIPFTREFAQTTADVFIRRLVSMIDVQHFFIGHDHAFGKDRGGNEELLRHLGAELGFAVEQIPPLQTGGIVVSSTLVRATLKDGNVELAAEMLGSPYTVRGKVVQGDGRGRTLGIPTANVTPTDPHKLLPGRGVYVVSATIDGAEVVGMANIGVRPTFTEDTAPTLEVHFLQFDNDIYQATLDVQFHKRLRGEQKFGSRDEFLAQLDIDRQQTIIYQQHIQQRRNS